MRLDVWSENPRGNWIWYWKLYADVEMPYMIDNDGFPYKTREILLTEGVMEFRPGDVTDDAIRRLLSSGPLLEQGKA
jgi:hypothetical protein